jgi:energy-coupling factor transporter transmembrane protein EcfT
MILQVVIGVVIGGIILFYLPSFIVFGIFGVIALIGLVVGAVTLVWLYDNPSTIILIGIFTAVLLIYRHYKNKQFARSTAGAIKRLEENIVRRRSNGYDNSALYSELYIIQEKLARDEK